MRLRQRPIAVSLLLFGFAPSLLHANSQGHVADLADGKPGRDTIEPPLPTASPEKSTLSIGKKDAPVDGKDGRPHQGPFIETEAERDRKKALESGKGKSSGDEKGSTSDKLLKEGWDDKAKGSDLPAELPKSNDGVMDDRNRFAPKEGTRGTEGGISEKSRDKLKEAEDTSAEKTPEEPKAVPPMPNSEQEKLGSGGSKASKSGTPTKEDDAKASSSLEEERERIKTELDEAELGGLTVCTFGMLQRDLTDIVHRSQTISQRSLTTYRILNQTPHPRTPSKSSHPRRPQPPNPKVLTRPRSSSHSTPSSSP